MRIPILILIALCLSGCGSIRNPFKLPSVNIELAEPAKEETPVAKVHRLEGELKAAKLERDEARLAGARRLLNWCTGILALCTIGGIVAAIFMKSTALGGLALACAGGAACAQIFQRALDHLPVISWLTLAAVVIVGGWMLWRYYRD